MRISWWSYRDRAALVCSVVVPPGIAAVLVPFRQNLPNAVAALILVVVIVAVAANGNRVAGIVAAASSAVWFDFFLTRPYERLTITTRADVETTVLLLLVGAAVTELAVRGRRQRILALTEGAYLAAIRSTTDLVSSDAGPSAVIEEVTAQLTILLGLRGCRFQQAPSDDLPRLTADGRLAFDDGFWDMDQFGMPDVGAEILATCNGGVYGRFVLDTVPGSVAPLAARQVAVILANQAALAVANPIRKAPGKAS